MGQFTFASSGTLVTGSDGESYSTSNDGSGGSGDTVTITNTSTSKTLTFELSAAIAGLDGVTLNVGSSAMTNGVAEAKVASFTANGTYTFGQEDSGDTLTLHDGTTTHKVTKAGGFSNGNEVQFDEAGIVIKLDSSGFSASGLSGSKLVVNDGAFTTVQVGSNNDADAPAGQASVDTNVTENRITYNMADA